MSNSSTTLQRIELTALVGNDVPHLNAAQAFLAPHAALLATGWWFVWFVMLALVVRFIINNGERDAKGNSR